MFRAITKANKEIRLVDVQSYPPIEDADLHKAMHSDPNSKVIQQICWFNIIYYLCHQGCENLRKLTISTFGIVTDPDNMLQYLYQCVDEADKITVAMTQQKQTKGEFIKFWVRH